MKHFLRDWWQELALIFFSFVSLILGIQFDLVQNLTLSDIAGILAAIIGFTAAATSFSNKVELQKRIREAERRTASQLTTDFGRILAEHLRSIVPFRFLSSRRLNYKAAREMVKELIEQAPESPRLLLTQFGSSVRSSLPEEHLLSEWERLIQAKGRVNQIHAFNPTSSELDRLRLETGRYPEARNYQLGAIFQPPPLPYFDLLVIEERAALVTFSTDTHQPTLADGAFLFRDPRSVSFLEDVFWVLWNRSTIVRGPGGEINEAAIAELQRQLEKDSDPVRVIKERSAVYDNLRRVLEQAKSRIDIISHDQLVSNDEQRLSYYSQLEAALERGVVHRRIIWNADHLQWIRPWLERHEDNPYLEVRFYDAENNPQLQLTFDLIDEQRACLLYGLNEPWYVQITDPDFVRLLTLYFERIWALSKSDTIKKYPKGVDWERLEQLEQRRGTLSSDVIALSPRESSYASMLEDLRKTESSLYIISYRNLLTGSDSRRNRYYKEVQAAMERGVRHRRIVWNRDHLAWLETRFAQGWDQLSEFQVYFLPYEEEQDLMTFDLIDERIILMGQGWRGSGHIRIEETETATYFRSYFERKWEKGARYPIKEAGQPPNLELLARLKKHMEGTSR